MKGWLANFPFQKFSIFIIIIVSFTYNVLLERDVLCSCKDDSFNCCVYMLGPTLIIFFLMICIDKIFLKACRFECTRVCCGQNDQEENNQEENDQEENDQEENDQEENDQEQNDQEQNNQVENNQENNQEQNNQGDNNREQNNQRQNIQEENNQEENNEEQNNQGQNIQEENNQEENNQEQNNQEQNNQGQNNQEGNNQEEAENNQRQRTQNTLFCGLLVYRSFKAFLVSLLWGISVLIDGDWFLCCVSQTDLACQDPNTYTSENKSTIAYQKSTSRSIGFGVLLFIFIVLAVISAFDWKKCCKCDKKLIYYELILGESKGVLHTTLKEAAKNDMTERIRTRISEEKWEKCFDVHVDMIRSSCRPEHINDRSRDGMDIWIQN